MNENTCPNDLQISIMERAMYLRRWVRSTSGDNYLKWWQTLVAPDDDGDTMLRGGQSWKSPASEWSTHYSASTFAKDALAGFHKGIPDVNAEDLQSFFEEYGSDPTLQKPPESGPGVDARLKILKKLQNAPDNQRPTEFFSHAELNLIDEMMKEGLVSPTYKRDDPSNSPRRAWPALEGEHGAHMPDHVTKNFVSGFKNAIHGEIYYVTPELGDQAALRMIRRISASLRPHELITPTGIMFLPENESLNFQKVYGYLGQVDRNIAVGWTTHGDTVTLYWICDQSFNNEACLKSWESGETFWTTEAWSPELMREEWESLMAQSQSWDLPSSDEPHILLPFHYWACVGDDGKFGPLARPDQEKAPSLPPVDVSAWRNENQTSTLDRFTVRDGETGEYESELWVMIAFACECIRMLGEEYKYVETANPIRSVDRATQRTWIKRGVTKNSKGINVYTLREGHLRREGKYLSRGPLETQHHRRAHWRGTKGHAGDLTCRHQFSPHPDDYNWRVCVPCGRVEHKVTDAIVGPEGAPWVANTRIGVLRR